MRQNLSIDSLIKQYQATSNIQRFNCGKVGYISKQCNQPQTKNDAAIPPLEGEAQMRCLDVRKKITVPVILNFHSKFPQKWHPTNGKQDTSGVPDPTDN